ncbi:aryl-alcohol dehydrogenase [Neohortaea acidophila]|uniref:Aryl-alcohol dehydrogenase n=1 Tax=Neohortaea acidophila TaxID=245834 RepID=A0A6A6Q5L2_9PEZI|nr:aryl-alcohol dehydrogenase [Neohortaea acidophila]KAF2487264.1 aryl-alcohol dehydrogenase [Neohortaea acidophila]
MATNGVNGHAAQETCPLEEFIKHEYDYLVVGGGTAGLCVAARLTENKDVTVGVLEAGANRMDDPQVYTPSMYPTLIGREKYDWCYQSVPQPNAGNKTYSMPRGKLLGGSSGINYLMYVRGSKNDYDGFAELVGSDDWNFESLGPYFRKHQSLDTPNPKEKGFMPVGDPEKYHGTEGPIHTSFNEYYQPFEQDFCEAAYEVGGKPRTLHDAYSGDHMGFYSSLAAIDRVGDKGRRSYAATGYFRPNKNRPNLKVLCEAHASKIVLNGNTATGVEFIDPQGKKHVVKASKEVILSGGVIGTPQLLELSGIGDPEVLKAAGVECLVENKAVGANFQDHVLGGMLYDLKPGIESLDSMNNAEFAKAATEQYEKTQNGPLGSPGMLMGFVSYASLVGKEQLEKTIKEIRANSHAKTDFEKRQEDLIVRQLSDDTFANIQTFCIPAQLDLSAGESQVKFFSPPPEGKTRVALLVCLEHPLSRGTVHITSSDPTAHPRIDPGYFRNKVDAKILAEAIKWMDKVAANQHMAKSLGDRVLPPKDVDITSEEARINVVENHIATQYHICGSCAMGEATDAKLKVRGVNHLRIIDASVFPSHVSGNIMATTYTVAEKGADLVKADDSRFK